eukprot:symbB.v1.2.013980.t1/scaffold1006.1/size144824/1
MGLSEVSLQSTLRIFAYDVPSCARPSLDVLQELEFEHDRLHLQGMMQQILAIE